MSDAERRRSAKRNLTALAAVALLPLIGSALLYWLWRPSSYVNYGELVAPLPLVHAQAPRALRDLHGKWVFLMVDSGACDDYCRRKLYVMRQVRLTQGEDMDRVERAWLVDDGQQPAVELTAQHPGIRLVQAQGNGLLAKLPTGASVRDHIYLVDPLGNVMLRYPRDPDPSRVMKDLMRLLKLSRIG